MTLRAVVLGLSAALWLASCSKSRTAPKADEPELPRAGAKADAGAAGSGGENRPHQVSKRDCARTEYTEDYALPDNPQCRTHADCGTLASCIGLPQQRCEYDSGLGATDDTCLADSDCTLGRHGRCPLVLGTTLCVHAQCATDADCEAGRVCRCLDEGGSGDPQCVGPTSCGSDGDCPGGQSCKEDESVAGAPLIWRLHCTTELDECSSMADCPEGGAMHGFCGFDFARKRWACGPYTIVD